MVRFGQKEDSARRFADHRCNKLETRLVDRRGAARMQSEGAADILSATRNILSKTTLIPMRQVLPMLLVVAVTGLMAPYVAAQAETAEESPDRKWTAHIGAGSPHGWNLVGITREFSDGHFRPFVTAGFGSFLVGGGAAYYTNPAGTGLVLSATGGLAGAQAAAVLDLRLSRRVGFVLGGGYGSYFLQHVGFLPIASLQVRL